VARIEPSRVFAGHDTHATRDACLSWVRDVADAIGYEPPQGIGDSYASFEHLPGDVLDRLVPLLQERPSTGRILEVAGPTWFEVLVAAGILGADGVRGSRGVRILARDGCVCLSLGEKLIDDILATEGIAHERERPYPGSSLRSDWRCGEVYIEYFGLTGDSGYDERTAAKLALIDELGLAVIAIYPQELQAPTTLRERLRAELSNAPRVEPLEVDYAPPAFEYIDAETRLRERRTRQREQFDQLREAGAIRNERLGVIEFLDREELPLRVPHRLDGPALLWDNGTEEWHQYGRPHRDDGGPAISRRAPERYEWFENGVPYREGGKPIEMERRRDGGWKVVVKDPDGRLQKMTFAAGETPPSGWLDFPPFAPTVRPNGPADLPPDRRFRGPGTPARVAHLNELVQRGAISEAEAMAMVRENRISDAEWSRIKEL
jgi:hypothetical protein